MFMYLEVFFEGRSILKSGLISRFFDSKFRRRGVEREKGHAIVLTRKNRTAQRQDLPEYSPSCAPQIVLQWRV